MRIVKGLLRGLTAILLFGLLVMGVSAQGGAAVPPPVVPETGTGGELQNLVSGLLYEQGSGYVPVMGASASPGALPVTGNGPQGDPVTPSPVIVETGTGGELQNLVRGLLYEQGSGYVPGIARSDTPKALPATGSSAGSGVAVQVPAPWFSTASANWSDNVIHALAGVSIAGSGQPEALPEAGTDLAKSPFYEALPPFLAPAAR